MARFVFSSTPVVEFGALTLSGAGGIALPDGETSISNNGGTNLTVSSGLVVPASAGVSSGTVTFGNGTKWDVLALANTYSVRSVPQLAACINLDATLSGRTVLLRPGSYGETNSYGKYKSFTSQVTFDAHDPTDKPIFTRWSINADDGVVGNVTIRNIRFEYDVLNASGDPEILNLCSDGGATAENVIVENCDFVGNLPAWSSGFSLPASVAAFQCIKGCAGLEIRDCTATKLVNFIAYACGTDIVIERNRATEMHGDFLRLGLDGTGSDTANVVIADNEYYDWTGNYVEELHGDFIQVFPRSSVAGDITDVQVLRNRVLYGDLAQIPAVAVPPNGPSENEIQFILAQGTATGLQGNYRRWTIRGNVAELNTIHGVTFEKACYDSVIEGNTFIASRRATDAGVSVTSPLIRGTYVDCIIRQNVVGGVDAYTETTSPFTASSGNTISDNYTTNSVVDFSDDTDLLTLFQGPSFKPDTPAELISQLRMKANGPLDADDSGGPTLGDIGALGTTTANGIADFDNRTINTGLILSENP